jgi:hypothetical protein
MKSYQENYFFAEFIFKSGFNTPRLCLGRFEKTENAGCQWAKNSHNTPTLWVGWDNVNFRHFLYFQIWV